MTLILTTYAHFFYSVGDPDLGFGPLRQFGPTLVHHTTLKIRSNLSSNFMIVDSPGMIDSPGSTTGMLNPGRNASMDRGYDFVGVVKWLAERADIVLLFFDPDKPGTTGETLSVLLHSLAGMDHKLLIVLNKADQFAKIHDFARAYGSLCWNLSKVIPRKDLPRIYTMCLPTEESQKRIEQVGPNNGLHDLYTARDQVVTEVRRAPERRLDNVLTQLDDSARVLKLHLTVLQDLQKEYSQLLWNRRRQQASVAFMGISFTALMTAYKQFLASATAFAIEPIAGGVLACTVLVTGGMMWYHDMQMQEWSSQAISKDQLDFFFARTHAREYEDETVNAIWQRIRGPLRSSLQQRSICDLPTISTSDLMRLDNIMEQDVPQLRRSIAPSHLGMEMMPEPPSIVPDPQTQSWSEEKNTSM